MSEDRPPEVGSRTVYLHVGTMKTGTTYLKSRLKEHRHELARDGVMFPGRQRTALRDWFGRRGTLANPQVAGAWDRMVTAMRTSDCAVGVLSMEYLSTCTPREVQEIVAGLAPAEVQIVVTVRDLPRVMAAQWQETLQNRAVSTWQQYSDDIVEHLADSPIPSAGTTGAEVPGAAAGLAVQGLAGGDTAGDAADDDLADSLDVSSDGDLGDSLDDSLGDAGGSEPAGALTTVRRTAAGRFWRQHDVMRIIHDWSVATSVDRVHIVTVPPSGAPSDLLWRRFCAVIGVDPDRYEGEQTVHANTGLDLAAAEFLRRLNLRLEPDIGRPAYLRNVKHLLGKAALVGREPALKPRLTPEQHERVVRHSERIVTYVQEQGFDVVGDLRDLVPGPLEAPPQVDGLEEKVTDAALDAVVAMIRELEERNAVLDDPTGGSRPAERSGNRPAERGGAEPGGRNGDRLAAHGGEREGARSGERESARTGERGGARRRARRSEDLRASGTGSDLGR